MPVVTSSLGGDQERGGKYKTWTLDSGLDHGLRFGLDFEWSFPTINQCRRLLHLQAQLFLVQKWLASGIICKHIIVVEVEVRNFQFPWKVVLENYIPVASPQEGTQSDSMFSVYHNYYWRENCLVSEGIFTIEILIWFKLLNFYLVFWLPLQHESTSSVFLCPIFVRQVITEP